MSTAILSGAVLLVATVVIHAVGTTPWVRFLVSRFPSRGSPIRPRLALLAIIWTAIILLVLHVVEIVLWAFAYLLLVPGDQLKTFEEAVYFSIVTFSSLGYGDVTLSATDWRVLSGIEALDGVLLAGWSTALLFAVVQRIWQAYELGGAAE